MTKIFCDRCGKDITSEEKEVKMLAGITIATLKKPTVDLQASGVNLIQDICWNCVAATLNCEYLEKNNEQAD